MNFTQKISWLGAGVETPWIPHTTGVTNSGGPLCTRRDDRLRAGGAALHPDVLAVVRDRFDHVITAVEVDLHTVIQQVIHRADTESDDKSEESLLLGQRVVEMVRESC